VLSEAGWLYNPLQHLGSNCHFVLELDIVKASQRSLYSEADIFLESLALFLNFALKIQK
jgi:hypothetical protein